MSLETLNVTVPAVAFCQVTNRKYVLAIRPFSDGEVCLLPIPDEHQSETGDRLIAAGFTQEPILSDTVVMRGGTGVEVRGRDLSLRPISHTPYDFFNGNPGQEENAKAEEAHAAAMIARWRKIEQLP